MCAKVKAMGQIQSRLVRLRRISVVRTIVLLLFAISGAAGLIYEVTWTRAFGVVFGNTVFAVSTVLTAFMLGLAAGSCLFGRIADNPARWAHPLRLYALLELATGTYAFVFPTILVATDIFYRWFFRSFEPGFYSLSLVHFVLSVIILLLPTALMGGTLPVLSKLWADSSTGGSSESHIGQSVGLLYAINTFGAVAGTFLAGYFLMRVLGVRNTIYLAASANILVGVLAFFLSGFLSGWQAQGTRQQGQDAKSIRPSSVICRASLVLVAVGLAGFCALALEVLWTRVLVFVLGTSAYVFACMLSCFILGIALGSFLCSRLLLARIRNPIFALGVVEFLVAISVLGSVLLLGVLGYIDFVLIAKLGAADFLKDVAAHFIDASVVLLLPTVLMGMVFPIAVRIHAQSWKAAGKRIGEVYACNTIGCVLGSFAAGFMMVPLLGLRDSFLVVVGIQLFLACLLIFSSERRRAVFGPSVVVVSVAVVIISVLSMPDNVFVRTMKTYHYPSEIVYIKDDATGTVTVHDIPDGDRVIAVDGVNVAGVDLMLRTTQKLQGYVPLIVHSNPKKVLQIGFGSGETSGVGLMFGVDEYSIVEICPGVFEAGRFFENINRGSYRDTRLRKVIMDGKNFVKLTDEKFDVIMNDSTYPGTTGSSALYTYDHFKQCRERLKPGGVLSCWLPIDLRPVDFQMIVRSFQEVLPHCCLWMANNCLNKHAVLMGTLSPLRIDFQRVAKLLERPDISSDLAIINIYSVYDFLDCFVVDQDGLRTIAGGAPLNTDDKPFLEFGAAIKRDVEQCWMVVLRWMIQNHVPVSRYVVNTEQTEQQSQQIRTTLEQYFKGTSHALAGLLGILQGDPDIMNSQFEMAEKINPVDRDVKNCLDELTTEIKTLAEAVQRTPANATLRQRLAKRYLLLRDYEHAAEQYRYYVGLEPHDAAGWNNLGVCCDGLKRFEEAVRAFEKAIEYNPELVAAYFNLAEAYEQLGNFAAASKDYQKALALSPASQKVYLYDKLARAYFMQKKYSLALDTLKKALELAMDDPDLRDYLLSRKEAVLSAAGRTEKAQR